MHYGKEGRVEALRDLNMAKELIEEQLIPQLQAVPVVLNLRPDATQPNNALAKQINTKINILKLQLQHISNAISVLENADSDSDIIIRNQKSLRSFFDPANTPKDEIIELELSGLQSLFEIEEI